jgi:hypothetical protein
MDEKFIVHFLACGLHYTFFSFFAVLGFEIRAFHNHVAHGPSPLCFSYILDSALCFCLG